MPKGSKLKLKTAGIADVDFGDIHVPDIDLSGIGIETPADETPPPIATRYTLPKPYNMAEKFVMYENAQQLARALRLRKNERAHCVVSGDFIFGDFIEAYMMTYNICATTMTIATLSLNQNNVDSLHHLMRTNRIERLNLIISSYFYGNERHALIPYIYQNLDIGNRFQLAVGGIHTKTTHFSTLGGKHIVIHGSANLRSSGNMEQFTIEENKALFDWYEEIYAAIIERYKSINHDVRNKELWNTISTKHCNN